jgi:hypothetical protein
VPIAAPMAMVGHCASCGDSHISDKQALASQRSVSANSCAWLWLATVPAVEIPTKLTRKLFPLSPQLVPIASPGSGWPLCFLRTLSHNWQASFFLTAPIHASSFVWLCLSTAPAVEIATHLTIKLLPYGAHPWFLNQWLDGTIAASEVPT